MKKGKYKTKRKRERENRLVSVNLGEEGQKVTV